MSEWSGFDLGKKKTTEANFQYWLGEISQNIAEIPVPVPRQYQVNWDTILRALVQQRTFVQLEHYITANPIPDCNFVANNMLMPAEAELLDMVVLHHMPNDMPAGLSSLQVEGDGNCFP